MSKAQGATLVRRFFWPRFMVAVRRAPSGAPVSELAYGCHPFVLVLSVMHLVELAKGYVDKSLDTLATH
mgnify:CR=1 FL=1